MTGRNQGRRKGVGLRAAIVTMRVFYHEKIEDIAKKIGVKARGTGYFMANLETIKIQGRRPEVVDAAESAAYARGSMSGSLHSHIHR